MTIKVERDYELVVLEISGRLDITTTPNLEKIINKLSEDTKEIVFDMSGIEYISTEGIKALLGAYRKMNLNQGMMRIEKYNDAVCEVLEKNGLLKMISEEG